MKRNSSINPGMMKKKTLKTVKRNEKKSKVLRAAYRDKSNNSTPFRSYLKKQLRLEEETEGKERDAAIDIR